MFVIVISMQLGNIKEIFNLGEGGASGGDVTPPTSYTDLQRREQEEHFPEIRMDLLDDQSENGSGSERNPFDFGTDRNLEEQMRLAEQRAEQARKMQEEQQMASQEPAAPPPPEIAMKFVGYARKGDESMAVFLDDKDLLIGKEGEVINEAFIIKKIGYESIVMGYVDFEEQTREIPMKGS
jgi:hypothetical protein